jgi:hypothetical protein
LSRFGVYIRIGGLQHYLQHYAYLASILRKRFFLNINKKKRGVTLALCSSVVKDFFTTGMVENVGYALWAVACSPTNQAIYIALADGVIKFA